MTNAHPPPMKHTLIRTASREDTEDISRLLRKNPPVNKGHTAVLLSDHLALKIREIATKTGATIANRMVRKLNGSAYGTLSRKPI